MTTQRIVIGIGAIIVIVAIMWMTRNKNNKVFSSYEKHDVKKITTLQEEYPYWGRGKNVGLRCARQDNTGCDAGYDSRGSLRRLHQTL